MYFNKRWKIFFVIFTCLILPGFLNNLGICSEPPQQNIATAGRLESSASFFGMQDYERVGYYMENAGDINGDGFEDFLIGTFHNRENGHDAGAVYLILGSDQNIWGQKRRLNTVDARFLGNDSYDALGYYVSGNGDINGDGFDDFLIGACAGNERGGPKPGHAFIFFGRPDVNWGYDCIAKDHADASFAGRNAYDQLGKSVAMVGDINGDGYDDFILGAPFNDDGDENGGKVYLFLGRPSGWHRDMNIESADASFIGTHANIWAGYTVSSAGDVNGDGLADFLIGSHRHEIVGGRAYLFFGRTNVNWGKDFNLYGADVIFQGESYGDKAGWSLACAGDVNNDGFSDLLIGACGNDDGGIDAGKVYLILGRKFGWPKYVNLADADASWIGERGEDNAGWSVAGLPDVNYDHCDEILIGSWLNDHSGPNSGKAYLIYGRETGWMKNVKLRDVPDYFTGEYDGDYAGYCVAGNDANGDGLGDIWVSATYNSEYRHWGGKIHLFLSEREYSEIRGQAVSYFNGNPIPRVTIRVDSSVVDSAVTDNNGRFSLLLPAHQSYSIRASKLKHSDLGVETITAYDASLILQAVVGLIQLDSLQSLVADVSENAEVTAYDAAIVARYAVGMMDSSFCTGEWRFDPPQRSYSTVRQIHDQQNFSGFVMGDVDGSWSSPDSSRLNRSVSFNIIKTNKDQFSIPIEIEHGKNFVSVDVKLSYCSDNFSYVSIEKAETIKDFHFIINDQPGKFNLAVFGAAPVTAGGEIIHLVFNSLKKQTTTQEIIVEQFQINNEPAAQGSILIESVEQHQPPAAFRLHQNIPNPFNNATTIKLSVSRFAFVHLAIYNLSGNIVRILNNENLPANDYLFRWDGTDDFNQKVSSGVYICRAIQDYETQSIKLLHIK